MLLLITQLLIAGNAAHAIPEWDKACPDLKLKGEATVYYSRDCSTIYVSPPEIGSISLSEPLAIPTVEQCKVVNTRRSNIAQQMLEIEDLIRQLNQSRNIAVSSDLNLTKIQEKIDKLKLIELQINAKLKQIENTVAAKQKRKQELLTKIEACKASPQVYCEVTVYDVQDIDDELRKIEETKLDVELKQLNVTLARETEEQVLAYHLERSTSQSGPLTLAETKLQTAATNAENRYRELMRSIQTEAGAKYNFTLSTDAAKHFEDYKSQNPSYASKMVMLPIKSGILSFTSQRAGEKLSFPIIMESSIAGASQPDNTLLNLGVDINSAIQPNSVEDIKMGRTITGSFVLNTLGICATLNADNKFDSKFLEATVTAYMTYEFDVSVKRNVTVYKSMRYLHEIIRQSSKKSRLFKSSTANSLIEKKEGESFLQVEFDNNDSDHDWKDREAMAKELRKDMIDEFLLIYGKEFHPKDSVVALTDPGPTGAAQAADIIDGKCKHLYCQFAVVGLQLGDALAGSSSSTSTYRSTLRFEGSSNTTDQKAVKRYDKISFKLKGE